MMFSINELANGSNFAWLGTGFIAWLAVIWLYYRGEWRHSHHKGLRESSTMFLKGACLALFANWAHRLYWTIYLIMLENGNRATLADLDIGRWVPMSISLVGAVGNVMMLYPMIKFFLGKQWWAFGAILIMLLWLTGIVLT